MKVRFGLTIILGALLLIGCAGSNIVSTPSENIDAIHLRSSDLSEIEKQNWLHLDLVSDTIPGMSVDKAYREIVKNKKGRTTIVAVIDSGIEVSHEDLDDVIWVNKDEIPDNGKDDDSNGYIDDINGWNFLGKGYDEQLELTRMLVAEDTSHPDYSNALNEHREKRNKYRSLKFQYAQLIEQFETANSNLVGYLEKESYTKKDLASIGSTNDNIQQSVALMKFLFSNGFETNVQAEKKLNTAFVQINDYLDYYLNKSFSGRMTGDDPNNFSQKHYGDANVSPIKKEEAHGTHVAGVIAAERDNDFGSKGVANNVKIMALRTVPNGDEYDKDVALAIRYAVDNGAKVINMSFGKYYSSHPEWVKEAILYAEEHDVLLVTGAGNEGISLDEKDNYPRDTEGGVEFSSNFISVGALYPKYGSSMVADYSNYSKTNVDIFAPGSDIYSPTTENEFDFIDGTSFASPAITGIAALIRSLYPDFTASEVKSIILDSGTPLSTRVVVGGEKDNIQSFESLSKSGKIANAYNALILAESRSKIKIP